LSIKDYLFNDWQNKYDGIISNPPYLKFQDFKNRVDALQEFQSRLGIKLSGFSNIYTLFLIKSLCQLNFHGKAAYIIPSEFLNADYGKHVKAFLLKNRMLRYVFIFYFNAVCNFI
jgi:adenine-specific DNA-methyltransferase